MASVLTQGKSNQVALTMQAIAAGTVAKGPEIDVSTKLAGTLKVHFGRMSTTSMSASLPEFRFEGTAMGVGGSNDMWVPITAWTPNLGANAATKITIASTPGANASALDATWTGITASDGLVFIQDTNDATRSEWIRILSITTSVATFQRTLTNIHTLTTNVVFDQAEHWSIPVSFDGEEAVRLVVDLAKNGTASGGVTAHAVLVTTDQINAT